MLRSFEFAVPQTFFCSFILSRNVAADPEKVGAITDFPTLANVTALSTFLGLVKQLAELKPVTASTAAVLQPLTSPRESFIWTSDHSVAFSKVKQALAQLPVLTHFDPAFKTVLQKDASRLYALLQEHGENVW